MRKPDFKINMVWLRVCTITFLVVLAGLFAFWFTVPGKHTGHSGTETGAIVTKKQ